MRHYCKIKGCGKNYTKRDKLKNHLEHGRFCGDMKDLKPFDAIEFRNTNYEINLYKVKDEEQEQIDDVIVVDEINETAQVVSELADKVAREEEEKARKEEVAQVVSDLADKIARDEEERLREEEDRELEERKKLALINEEELAYERKLLDENETIRKMNVRVNDEIMERLLSIRDYKAEKCRRSIYANRICHIWREFKARSVATARRVVDEETAAEELKVAAEIARIGLEMEEVENKRINHEMELAAKKELEIAAESERLEAEDIARQIACKIANDKAAELVAKTKTETMLNIHLLKRIRDKTMRDKRIAKYKRWELESIAAEDNYKRRVKREKEQEEADTLNRAIGQVDLEIENETWYDDQRQLKNIGSRYVHQDDRYDRHDRAKMIKSQIILNIACDTAAKHRYKLELEEEALHVSREGDQFATPRLAGETADCFRKRVIATPQVEREAKLAAAMAEMHRAHAAEFRDEHASCDMY